MILFDTHCHIDDERFDEDRSEALARMAEAGVRNAVIVGSDMPSSANAITFAKAHPAFYAGVGIHPHEAKHFKQEDIEILRLWLREKKVVALGEIGLDYYYDHSPREVQRYVCMAQIQLAYEEKMPVIFHVRDAHGDMLDMFKNRKESLPEGIIHCFSGSWESAKEYLRLGFYISFAGPVTFKKAPNLWETATNMPIDRLLIETDSPYMAPEPKRGRRNEPAFVAYVAQKIAALRNMDVEELAAITTENAKRIYHISN